MNRPLTGLLSEWNFCGLSLRRLVLALAAAFLVAGPAPAQDQTRPLKRGSTRSKTAAPASNADAVSGDAAPADQKALKKESSPLTLLDVIHYAEPSREAMEDVKDYTAVFNKTELIKGRLVKQVMEMKFRTKPFSVYFRYLSGPEKDRQAIFVEGKFGNKLVVKETGIKAVAGVMYLALDNQLVMAENRYPVTNVGIGNLLNTAMTVWERESKLEAADVDVKFFPNARLGELPVEAVQLTHRKQLRDVKYHLSRVYFDKETKLPLRAERYGWPRQNGDKPPLVEDYVYTKLKTNVKLSDMDFDPRHYGF
jgi:hypothetical protein